MSRTITVFMLCALVLGFGAATSFAGDIYVDWAGGGDYTTIQAAIAAATAGDVIHVADGTYTIATTLYVNKSVTIDGASEGGVILDASGCAGYGMVVEADGVVLRDMTMLPPAVNYPIHASGTGNPPGGYDGLTIEHMTIEGVHQRTAFDIHGYSNVLLSYLTAGDATGGNGIQVTGCLHVDMDNIVTHDNAWGSIAIYCSTSAYLNRGSDDVEIDGDSCTLGEGNIYSQDEDGLTNTNVTVLGYEYLVKNDTALPGYDLFQDTLTDAATVAAAVGAGSYITEISTGDLVVVSGMGIQAAIDAADPGDTIEVAAGTYNERLTLTDGIDLRGAQYGVDPTLGGRTNPAAESIIDITGIGVANPNVAVELTSGATGASVAGFTVIGSPTFNYADETVFRAWCGDLTIEDNIIDGYIGVLHKGGVSTGISRNLMTVNKNGIILQPGIYDSFTIDGNVAMLGSTPAGGESALYMTGATNISVTGNDFTSFPNGNAVGGSNNSNVTISGNNLSHCKKGVNFWGNTTFIDVIDNTIYNCSDAGVNIKGQDLSVTGNIFGGCSIGFEVGVHTLTTERVTAFNNDFSGCSTAGVVVSPSVSEMVDASGNFWGSAVPAQVRAKANGGADIDYTPWLASGLFMNPGFSGDFSTLWVDDDSDQTGTTGRVQEGIDLVSGSTLRLAPGTYLERPVASKSVYIRGDTQANTFIDAGVGATGGSYGFTVSADDVTVAYLTLLGDTGLSTPRYGFKASQVSNFTMLHVTAKEFYRTGVDLLGVTNGDLQYVTSIDNDGHGLALTDCNGVHIASLSVGGNAWQGVSVATWGRYSPLGTSGIVFQYPNNFDDPFQLEMGDYNNPGVPPAGDAIITYSTSIGDGADVTVSASEFGFAVHGEQDDAPDQARIWFAETFADAAALVATPQSHFTGDGMYVESLTDATQLYVTTGGSIQAAIDAADDYDTINVSAGTYVEALLIEKPVSVLGATAGINKNGYAVPAGYAWDDAVESIIVHPDPASGYVTIVDIHDTDDVVFKGFVVGELSAVGNLNTSLVRVYAHSFAIDNIVVENNVIGPNTNTVSQDGTHGRMGLYLVNHPYSDQGITNSSFSHNKIFDTKGNGDNIFLWTSYYAYGAPGPASMAGTVIDDNEIYGSHRAGIETAGGFSDLTISNNTIYGNSGLPGDDPDKLKYGHGILLIRGSSDKVSNPLTAFGPVDLVITGNNIYDNEKSGIYTGPKNDGIYIENNLIHDNGWNGMIVDLAGNYWNPQFESPPVSEQYACYDCAQNVFVNDNMIWGNAGAGTPASDYGVAVNGVPTNGFILDAEDNWWGDPTGPYHATVNPTGLGEKVTDYVDFDPYRTGNIICDPDPEYLSLSIPGTTIDVDYLGGGSGLIYGYNVTVTWDDALVEAVPGDVTQGTLLSSAGSTFFNVQQPSSSELTIDCIILGAHSGVTGPGTMFSIDFDAKVPVGYGVSPVDITVNRVRDYANQTLTGFFADDGEIIVDTVAPVISYVHVTNWTLTHTDDYIKDTDHATVDALVTDAHPSFGLTNIDGDLVGLGGGASVNPNSYGGGTATWDLPSVTCDPSDGTVTVTVTATDAHGNSSNLSDTIIADNTAPTAVTGFDAAPAYGECDLTWTNGSDTYYYGTVVRREAIGGEYPQYPWFVSNWATGVDSAYPTDEVDGTGAYDGTGESHTDVVVDRNIYYYQAFCYDWALNYGPAATTARDLATNYWLGDISDGFGSGWGYDGVVDDGDILMLGGVYGTSNPVTVPGDAECDIGPTVHPDWHRLGLPKPDNAVEFEDAMIFAMNYGVVSARVVPFLPEEHNGDVLALTLEERGVAGDVVEVALKLEGNTGEVKGMSASVAYDPSQLEFVSAVLTEDMSSPLADVFFWSGVKGDHVIVDALVLGTDVTIGGSGDVATLTFRTVGDGYTLDIESARIRNAGNVELDAKLGDLESGGETPLVFRLVQNAPNPFNPVTKVAYHVPRESDVTIRVYDVSGRVVRTLVDGVVEPGRHAAVWDGRNDSGETVGSGIYFCTMEAPEFHDSRKMTLLK